MASGQVVRVLLTFPDAEARDAARITGVTVTSGDAEGIEWDGETQMLWSVTVDGRGEDAEAFYHRPVCDCGTLPHPRGAAAGCIWEDEG